MRSKQKFFLALLSITLMVLSTSAWAADKEKNILLKLPVAFSTNMPTVGEVTVTFKEYLESASGGNMKVKIYEPGKLMPVYEILDAVSTGKVNAGYTASGYTAGKIKAAEFYTAIPFSQSVPYFISWLYFGNGGKLYQKMYDRAGYNVKVFPFCFLAPETAGWFRKEINSPEDLKGLNIRFFGLGGKVLSKLGASVTSLPGGECFPALEKGAIDATEFATPAVDTQYGFYKVAKYNYFPSWHQPATHLELLINKDTWNSMSPQQQALIEVTTRAINLWSMAKSHAEQGSVVRENAEKHGTQNLEWSPELLKLFRETWLEVIEEETSKDVFLKEIWEDYKAFQNQCKPYESVAHLPRPE
ncbi:TRAP transporter substrate-binding protein [Desulfotignum balticum]|uniref:TRAP transporter substrate-binding protein n=1 Tax=Desulfotignum balticum TaxID=115781 RepID=UPI000462A601|nr:TRAP transporter substrate-binding protein [Desulfotignum balticum]